MNSRISSAGALLLAAVLLVAVNILSSEIFPWAQIDLTEHHLYTLSQGTRRILRHLQEPITLRLFLSQKLVSQLPSLGGYTLRVRELLAQYRRIAGGKIRLEVIDPEPFSKQEDRALAYGLHGVPLGNGNSDFYFGLVGTNSTDQQQVIPFFAPDRADFLEYDVTKLVYELAHPKHKVIGLLSALPMQTRSQGSFGPARGQPTLVLEEMQQQFTVHPLAPDIGKIPADIDVLMLVRPRDLSVRTLYAVDQFVMRGGHALVFVDPYAEADPRGPYGSLGSGRKSSQSTVEKLLESWGVRLVPGKVAGDIRLAEKVRFTQASRTLTTDYPVWMDLQQGDLDHQDLVTANLADVVVATPGVLSVEKAAGTRVRPLLETTPDAMEFDAKQLGVTTDPENLVRRYRPGGKRLMLAARITGEVKTAFPGGPPPAPGTGAAGAHAGTAASPNPTASGAAAADKQPRPLAASRGDVNVIVVADTDLLRDRFWAQVQNFFGSRIAIPNAANGSLVINALDNLTGSNELISIRSRGGYTRPLTRIDAIREQADLRFQQTEQELVERLKDAQRKLAALQSGKMKGNGPILSKAQEQELARFRRERVTIREKLRHVRHRMRRHIAELESWIKFVDIACMPLLIGIGGVAVGTYRVRRRGRRAASG